MKISKPTMTSVTAAVLVTAGELAQAAQSQATLGDNQARMNHIPVETYRYGMELGIARVLHTSDTSQVCGVVPAVMQYEDSQGGVRA